MKITIAGGDLRMITAGLLLRSEGYDCRGFGLGDGETPLPTLSENEITPFIAQSAAVILPLPCQRDGVLNTPLSQKKYSLNEILDMGNENTLFIGGQMPKGRETFIDYANREDFQIKNAVPTAEGALALALNELNTTIFDAKVVVVGYGRIGKYLSHILKSLGAQVFVVARSSHSRAFAETNRIKAMDFDGLQEALKEAQVVFNTVPSMVIGEKEISAMAKGCILMDLASLPGGTDEAAAQSYGVKFLRALSLPGKVAPITAGRIVFETVDSILRERGMVI